MAGETTITLIGNLTDDPELRFTPSGAAVANFNVASTPRTFDRNSNEWRDGETLFMRCAVWRDQAENAAESLQKGMRVVVTGRLVSRSWDDKDTGQKRTALQMEVEEVAPSLRYATAKVVKAARGQAVGGQNSGGGWGQQPQQQGGGDPWAAGSGQQQQGWGQQRPQGGGRGYDEPPF